MYFSELVPHHGGKTAGIDMVWRNYVTVTLCIFTSFWYVYNANTLI